MALMCGTAQRSRRISTAPVMPSTEIVPRVRGSGRRRSWYHAPAPEVPSRPPSAAPPSAARPNARCLAARFLRALPNMQVLDISKGERGTIRRVVGGRRAGRFALIAVTALLALVGASEAQAVE